MSRKCRAGVAGCRASTASCRASIARVSRNIARVSKMMNNSVSCVFYFAGTKNTDYHFDAGDFSASANQSSKFFVLDCVLLVTDIFWQTGGLIGGHGASSQRVWPKTRPKEARRTFVAGVALFHPRLYRQNAPVQAKIRLQTHFFRVGVLPLQPPAGLDRSAAGGPKHVSLSCGFGKKIGCCLPSGHMHRLC